MQASSCTARRRLADTGTDLLTPARVPVSASLGRDTWHLLAGRCSGCGIKQVKKAGRPGLDILINLEAALVA